MKAEIRYNAKTFRKLEEMSDICVYQIARQTLDKVGQLKATAYKSGLMERTMYSRGVQADIDGYYIGNFTTYAKRVYRLKEANWTNKNTRPQWFHSVWQEYGELITDNCIKRYGLG